MKYIIGNWKMFPKSVKEAKLIVTTVKKAVAKTKRTKVVICPPSIYLGTLIGKGKLLFGAQNIHAQDEGAYTGEISAAGVKTLGATFAIVGHSERRTMGETNAIVAEKAQAGVRNGLTVILCVGEKVRDDSGVYFGEIREQLLASLVGFPKNKVKQLVVAYEPIWAIGKNALRAATPEDLEEIVILLRKTLVHFFGKQYGFTVPILYGGSVDDTNAEGFMKKGKADGLLIGRTSLDTIKLNAIIQLADILK